MAKLEIVKDSEGNKIVLIPEILFFNKQNIEWELVEQYLENCGNSRNKRSRLYWEKISR